MTENGYHLLIVATFIIVLYKWLSVRLSAMTQPLRYEMIEISEELFVSERLADGEKRILSYVIDSAFSVRTAWRIAILFPFSFLMKRTDQEASEKQGNSSVEQRKLIRCLRLGILSTLSNSPAALTIFLVELVIFALIVAPTGRLVKRTIEYLISDDSGGPPHRLAH